MVGRGIEKFTFEPSKNQDKFLFYFLDYDKKYSMEDIAKEIGISRQAIYKWYQDQEFVNWINSKKDEVLSKGIMGIYKTAMRKAQAGDFQFAKLILEIKGEYVQKTENKNFNVATDFEELSDKEMVEGFKGDLEKYQAIIARENKQAKSRKTEKVSTEG